MFTQPAVEALDRLVKDTAYAVRQLVRTPSFAIAAVTTLALGIGATAAVFSVVEAVVLRPLPFVEPDRVVNLHPTRNGVALPGAANLEYAAWRDARGSFSKVAAIVSQNAFVLTRAGTPEVILGARATSDYLRVVGVAPALGRGFTAGEDQPGAPHVAILSYKLWARDFNRNAAILGQQVHLDGEAYTVIGVMPALFDRIGSGDELWTPLPFSGAELTDFRSRYLQLVARLAPGVSLAQASSAIATIERRISAEHPTWGDGYAAEVHRYADDVVGDLSTKLFILLGAVSFVFLIACVNVANLLLARSNSREREVAVRLALGASRGRLVGQFLTESAVLGLVSGAVGIALAFGLIHGLIALAPAGLPRITEARIDGWVLLFTLTVALGCSVGVGLMPALRATGRSLPSTLRDGGRGASEGRGKRQVRNVLVAAEVALAMTLLSGAALLIRTAWEISHVNPGFDATHVLTAQMLLPAARYPDLAAATRVYHDVRDALERTPGIRSAALTSALPLGGPIRAGIGAEGEPMTDGQRLIVDTRLITPGYFSTLKIHVQSGRDFTAADNQGAPLVAIISTELAAKLWPGQSPMGKRLEGMDPSHTHFMTVVGVIAGARDVSLQQAPTPELYIPFEQALPLVWGTTQGSLTLVARTVAAPETMAQPIRAAIDGVDPSLPTTGVATMDNLVQVSESTATFNTLLLSTLGALALLLASIGVYGVIAYSASQRTREIALRLALGASPRAVAGLVIQGGLMPVVSGAMVGTALSVLTTRLLRQQLFQVTPGDPATLALIAAVLLLVSLLAASIPARRAMRLSPASILG